MNTNFPLVEIFILSYNRPEYILETLESIIQQSYPNLKIVVSDNSSKDEVEDKIHQFTNKSKITYIRRKPSLPAIDHFNKIFSEASADFFIVFHDDDLMLPEAVSKLVSEITKSEDTAAVGGNAYVLEGIKFTKKIFDPYLTAKKTLSSPDDLAIHYLQSIRGHVPFPSYIYRRKKIQALRMNFKEGQKHSDVSFLIKVSKQGPVVWLTDQVLHYRRHQNNDSMRMDIPALFSLCRFIKKNTKIPLDQITQFKMKSYILWAKQRKTGVTPSLGIWRDKVIVKAALFYALTRPQIFILFFSKRISLRLNALMQSPNNPK